jgi:hypothetical protein
MGVRNVKFLGATAADLPEADSGQDDGETEEDRRFVPLERPVAAGGLIRHWRPEVDRGIRCAMLDYDAMRGIEREGHAVLTFTSAT